MSLDPNPKELNCCQNIQHGLKNHLSGTKNWPAAKVYYQHALTCGRFPASKFLSWIENEIALPNPTRKRYSETGCAIGGGSLAADLQNDPEFPKAMPDIAERYDWSGRRLNSAVTYLLERDLLRDHRVVGSGAWCIPFVSPNENELRRFVKSRTL